MTQIVQTTRALRKAGLDAMVVEAADAVASRADIVHVFGDVRPLLALGRPTGRLAVSPIYFPRHFVLGPATMYRRADAKHRANVWLRHHARSVRRFKDRRRSVREFEAAHAAWRRAELVVVNSEAERMLLLNDSPSLSNVRIAHSGVEPEAFDGDPDIGRHLLGLGDDPFVLCVARVEPIKNQVSLAMAVRRLRVRLVLVGMVLPGNQRYLEEVRSVLPDVVHVPHIEHDLLRHVHAAASAHALTSWYETTGLSTLEALAVGRPVVVSGGPCVEEYFGGCANFCTPASVRSISRALEEALVGPRGCERDHARSFTWDRTARELLDAYATVLDAA